MEFVEGDKSDLIRVVHLVSIYERSDALFSHGMEKTTVMINRESCCTLIESLQSAAQQKPKGIAFEYVYINRERDFLTFDQLLSKSLRVANSLLEHIDPGDRVLLPCFQERAFHIGFFACLLAGCIAVPCHHPRVKKKLPLYGLGRFHHIVEDSGAKLVLAPELLCERVSSYFEKIDGLKTIKLLALEQAEDNVDLQADCINHGPDTIAYLQYTSGSTSSPKGVVITHECIINNQRYMNKKGQVDDTSTYVNWLPLYHDMGLTFGCMSGIWLHCHTVIMSPVVFISRPEIWLTEISGRHGVVSGAPNFAYALCVNKVTSTTIANLDLSGWRIAINGSEPLVAENLYQFSDKFGACGFAHETFYPAYGMAEATLFVCGSQQFEPPVIRHYNKQLLKHNQAVREERWEKDSMALVGCGNDFKNAIIAIVDAKTHQLLDDGEVGEIWICIDSAGKGYWKNIERSNEVFDHMLVAHGKAKFFRSGDMGFMDEGELFVSGRIKELIIVNGANHYPHDIELAAKNAHQELTDLMVAAFTTVHSGKEFVELVVESPLKLVKTAAKKLLVDIRELISAEFHIKLRNIHLVKMGTIPRTTSGKIQRSLCREQVENQSLDAYTNMRLINDDVALEETVDVSI